MLRALLLSLLCCSLLSPPALAAQPASPPLPSETHFSVLQDDALFLGRGEAEVARQLARARELGVSHIRLTAEWIRLAPRYPARNRGFHAGDSRTYRQQSFKELDRAVSLTHALGMSPMLDLGFRVPKWGLARDGVGPDSEKFKQFAIAIASRYNGSFIPAGASRPLPAVPIFTLHNEPNFPAYYRQWRRVRGRTRALSPDMYRRLVKLSYPSIKRYGAPGVRVLTGATSPYGRKRGKGPLAPLDFLLQLSCVTREYKPLRGPGCRHFKRLPSDGWSHHPYALEVRPDGKPSGRGDVLVGNLKRLTHALLRLQRMGRLTPAGAQVWLTEFGYESNAQVSYKPWTEQEQAELLAQAEYLSWCEPQAVSFANFLLADLLTPQAAGFVKRKRTGKYYRYPGAWQTGLFREDGSPKPAALGYRNSLVLLAPPGAQHAYAWGRLRTGAGVQRVEGSADGGASWSAVLSASQDGSQASVSFQTDPGGYFMRALPLYPGARYRIAQWTGERWWPGVSTSVPAHRAGSPLTFPCRTLLSPAVPDPAPPQLG